MENEVESMEQRLQMLKAMMADEKAQREAKAIPGGGTWRSGRQDGSGNGARYVDKVLRERPAPLPTQQAPLWTGAAAEGARGVATTKPASAGRVGRLRSAAEAAAVASAPVAVSPPPAGQAKAAAPRPGRFGARAPAQPAAAAAQPTDSLSETRDISEAFSWRPDVAIARGDDDGFASYEDLLAPDPEPAPRMTPARAGQGRAAAASASGGGDASTAESAFDEDASAASFQEALRAWRGEPAVAQPAVQPPPQPKRETAEEIWARAQQASAPAKAPPAQASGARRAAESSEPAAEISTQAGTKAMNQMSFYERLQEQKRRDGLL